MSTTRMNDFVLQQLLAENQRLRQELESSKSAIKVSEACQTLIDYVQKTQEPLDRSSYDGPNEFIESGGCSCLGK